MVLTPIANIVSKIALIKLVNFFILNSFLISANVMLMYFKEIREKIRKKITRGFEPHSPALI